MVNQHLKEGLNYLQIQGLLDCLTVWEQIYERNWRKQSIFTGLWNFTSYMCTCCWTLGGRLPLKKYSSASKFPLLPLRPPPVLGSSRSSMPLLLIIQVSIQNWCFSGWSPPEESWLRSFLQQVMNYEDPWNLACKFLIIYYCKYIPHIPLGQGENWGLGM